MVSFISFDHMTESSQSLMLLLNYIIISLPADEAVFAESERAQQVAEEKRRAADAAAATTKREGESQ